MSSFHPRVLDAASVSGGVARWPTWETPEARDWPVCGELRVIVRPERVDPPERPLMRRDLGADPVLHAVEQTGELRRGRLLRMLQIADVQLLNLGERKA